MGNQQSNERQRNYKIRKITNVDENTDYFRCFLDDYVTYSDGDYKHMDFKKTSTGSALMGLGAALLAGSEVFPGALIKEGQYIAIDIDITCRFSRNHNFDMKDVKNVGREEIDSDGNVSIIAITREVCQEIIEVRERRARANE